MAGGLLLVTFAGTRYVEGEVRAGQLREEWNAAQARAEIEAIRNGTAYVTAGAPLPGSPVARLRIPKLGLDEIVVEGVGDAELNVGPGHLPGSAMPGLPGNAVISAHRDRHFARLGGITVGDTVVTEQGPRRVRWVIASRRVVKAGAPALFQSAEPILTLTTCWPIRYFGSAPDRLVLTAHPVVPTRDDRGV